MRLSLPLTRLAEGQARIHTRMRAPIEAPVALLDLVRPSL